MKKRFYTAQEYCKIVRISLPTFYRWIKKGKIYPKRIGRKWLIPYYEIPTFLRDEGKKQTKNEKPKTA